MIPVTPKTLSNFKKKNLLYGTLGKVESFYIKGVIGLLFEDLVKDVAITYDVTIERHEKGLCLYCRHFTEQKWILIPFDLLQSIVIHKKPDVLIYVKGSWFRLLQKMGISYRRARPFILEKEWLNKEEMFVKMTSIEDVTLVLTVKTKYQDRVVAFFKSLSLEHKLLIDVSNYEYI